jgi:presequence protease
MFKNLSRNFSLIKQSCWKSSRLSTVAQQKLKSTQDYSPGNIYNGFKCLEVEFIEDFNMTAMIFEHERTGLKYIHLDRNDSNNLFSINFRTTPFDSTGLPHILEVRIS